MSVEQVIIELDELKSNQKHKEICDLIEKKYTTDEYKVPELLWRYSAALYEFGIATKDKAENKRILVKALEMSKLGLEKDTNNIGCNKWYGILLDITGRIEGIKKRIENSFNVKKHLDIANERSNKSDTLVLHALGVWCYEVSALSWMNRKLAETFFSTPPTSTFEEALVYFLDAEKEKPGFLAANYLYIGKTYDQLNKKSEAKEYFQKCANVQRSDVDTLAGSCFERIYFVST